MESRRVILAVFLSFLALLLYQNFVVKPRVAPATSGRQAGRSGPASLPSGQVPPASDQAASQPATGPQPAAPGQAAVVGANAEQDVIVETDHVRAVFSNRGGVLRSWRLKHYLDSRGEPIDIVPAAIRDPALKPFAISIPDQAASDQVALSRVNQALFRSSVNRLDLGSHAGTLAFDYEDASGFAVTKRFDLQPPGQPYIIRVSIQARQGSSTLPVTIHGGAGFGDLERAVAPSGFFAVSTYQAPQAIYQLGTDVTRTPATSLGAGATLQQKFRYAGVDDHYFLAALLPGDRDTRVDYRPVNVTTPFGPRNLVDYRVSAGEAPARFFYGPKDFDVLQAVDGELVRAIHFGVFGFLATPLLKSLKWVNAFVGNYGWSIILLTIFINLLMFPLRHKSVVSMRKMQELQPQVKAIQDRYANLKATDPAKQKMNAELMNLYREKGVNPASGCVPMLLTMPVLFAFYALLSVAIELRGAPFIGWIRDLSTYDPLYVTPLLMGATQFWQTRITPMTGDPAQQRMMMIMPLMFMVFFLWAPSGLVLYWLVSNVWTIGQQYVTNYLIGPSPHGRPRGQTVRAPAEKRAR